MLLSFESSHWAPECVSWCSQCPLEDICNLWNHQIITDFLTQTAILEFDLHFDYFSPVDSELTHRILSFWRHRADFVLWHSKKCIIFLFFPTINKLVSDENICFSFCSPIKPFLHFLPYDHIVFYSFPFPYLRIWRAQEEEVFHPAPPQAELFQKWPLKSRGCFLSFAINAPY